MEMKEEEGKTNERYSYIEYERISGAGKAE
ncbi:hypothetical protein FITA111629_08970 [Filibacter tadaridae]|uniref:Uncharacterized protein n=1 Tax=Filibacter tadaridae TaxID=2483811 RepID=A0A3P5WSP3_9BACL|nr:hypothetical protein FILTAD_00630 [Filibacter tadaridae]